MLAAKRFSLPSTLLLAAFALTGGALAQSRQQPAADWRDRVDPWVLETAVGGLSTEFLVVLDEQADVSGAGSLRGKDAKGRYVFEALSGVAARTQGPVLAELDQLGVEHRPYWIVNMIWVRGDLAVVERMARRSDVARVSANPRVRSVPEEERCSPPTPGDLSVASTAPSGIEPNIVLTGAPAVFWNAGFDGEGIVIGAADTGYEWHHPALINSYRGSVAGGPNHNYNWHDAIHSGGGICGANSPEPCDDCRHGTHTLGIAVGSDGGENQIGMAPGAKWIGCRNEDERVGSPTTYSECMQWFVAPTDLNDENPDPTKAPHVVNISWSCSLQAGCTDPNIIKTVMQNVRAAGIFMAASANNQGSTCSSMTRPPAIYDEVFSVGMTDNAGLISGQSARGPITVDGSGRMKPDISAPGVAIRSCKPTGIYGEITGTSMAAPHVAGMAALILQAAPCWEGDIDRIEQHLIASAENKTTTQNCGGVPGSNVPNNTYGFGFLKAQMPQNVCAEEFKLTVTGTCPGPVTVNVTGAPPSSEVGIIAAAKKTGFIKGGIKCNGMVMEIGEPFVLPPRWVVTNANGAATVNMDLPANRCWVEALSARDCTTTQVVFAPSTAN